MDLSIIGYSERVKKYYLTDKNLNIHKILRTSNAKGKLFTSNIEELLRSEFIIISLNQNKTHYYLSQLKKLKFNGQIIIETPSISIIKYYLNSFDKNIIVLEDLVYANLVLKIKKIKKKEGLKKLFIINRGYFVFYHFLSIIYFWSYNKLPKLCKTKHSLFYLKNLNFYIKTDLKKKSNGLLYIKLKTYKNDYKFNISNSRYYKKNNTNLYLKYVQRMNKNYLNILDYNKINIYVLYLKIIEKIFSFLKI